MKKTVVVLAIVLGLFTSCSSDDDNDNGPIAVEKNNLVGKYKIIGAVVATPIDYNEDGIKSNNLLSEGYNSCDFDNYIEFTENNLNYIMKGQSCEENEKDKKYTYSIDEQKKSISIYEDEKVLTRFENLELDKIDEEKKVMYFKKFDKNLDQNVFFTLQSI